MVELALVLRENWCKCCFILYIFTTVFNSVRLHVLLYAWRQWSISFHRFVFFWHNFTVDIFCKIEKKNWYDMWFGQAL